MLIRHTKSPRAQELDDRSLPAMPDFPVVVVVECFTLDGFVSFCTAGTDPNSPRGGIREGVTRVMPSVLYTDLNLHAAI